VTNVNDLSFECDLEAPPEQVWRALTVPELRAAWLGESESGACETIEAASPKRLVVRWSLDEPASTVTFDVEPREAGSRLTITHRPAAALAEVIPLRPPAAQTVMCAGAWKMAA
jgi:uncharacterized protein YndB with AHSA1/START domain